MRIAILGTRGIPNSYGGFEQFAEYLSLGLVQHGIEVTVYNSDSHPFKGTTWNGVNIVHCYDPERKIGTAGQFLYDLNCILDCRKRNFDVVLELGYTSSSVWFQLLNRRNAVLTTNMDGHEWKRSKYSKSVQRFLQHAEKLAAHGSQYLIADSVAIQEYLKMKYQKDSTFIPYGANVFHHPDENVLKEYGLSPFKYDMLLARLEPENNIETIIRGIAEASSQRIFLVVGNSETKYGENIKSKFSRHKNIRFLNGIYDIKKLNSIRYFSTLYFHGHCVGGTNPSLLEAMASHALICAHDNLFNAAVLGEDGYYFKDSSQVTKAVEEIDKSEEINRSKLANNIKKIESNYSWPNIVQQYIDHFNFIVASKKAPVENRSNFEFTLETRKLEEMILNQQYSIKQEQKSLFAKNK